MGTGTVQLRLDPVLQFDKINLQAILVGCLCAVAAKVSAWHE